MRVRKLVLALLLAAGFMREAGAVEVRPEPAGAPSMARLNDILAKMKQYRFAWARIGLTVAADGKVEAPHVLASYPKGLPEAELLRAATSQKFKPGTRDGVPTAMPTELSYAMTKDGNGGSVSSKMRTLSEAAVAALNAGEDHPAALEEMRVAYERDKMTLAEVGFYHFLLARQHRHAKAYQASIDAAETALSLAMYYTAEPTVVELQSSIVLNYFDLGAPEKAIDYYDSWREEVTVPPPAVIGVQVETARAKTPGAGHRYPIAGFKSKAYKHAG